MKRSAIGLAGILVFGLVAASFAAEAPAGKAYRIGILGEKASDPSEARLWQGFRTELEKRGWIEGKNILIESRWAEGNSARLPELAADLVRLRMDLIVTRGSIYVQAARTATSSIPIVFTMHADPIRTGHVASLARPGGNVTGLTIVMTDLDVKGLEMLAAAVPKLRRIAFLGNPDVPSYAPTLKALEEAARHLGLQLQTVTARTAADLERAFSAMARAQAQAVVVFGYASYMAARQHVAELALRHRLPTFFTWRDHVEVGGLMSYAPDLGDLVRRGAIYVDKILRGAKPAELPVEQATTFELVINLKTAKALGLTIPPSLLLRADHIID
ncbi:MAG TPA: ABC transporter substrate-binding protein [bacterium]|nr:ABC transporter substrate-binding protein [bacterium]